MADFVDGIFVKTVETKFGEIIKLSFNVEKFKEFLQDTEHLVEDATGRKFLNVAIKNSKSGGHYIEVDTWKPSEPSGGGNPFDGGSNE